MTKSIQVLISGLLLITSCTPEYDYSETVFVNTLSAQDSIRFDFDLSANTTYHFDLLFNHEKEFAYENFYAKLIWNLPGNYSSLDTVSFQLSTPDGRWLGRCNNLTCQFIYKNLPPFKPTQNGKGSLNIVQFSRQDKVDHIRSLGLGITIDK